MTTLDLRWRGLTTLEGVIFPENLEVLDLKNNGLTSLEGVPENLKFLYLGNNRLTNLNGLRLPENFKTLRIDSNVPKEGCWAPYRIKALREASIETFDSWFQTAMKNKDAYLGYYAFVIQNWYRSILYRPGGPIFEKAYSSFQTMV